MSDLEAAYGGNTATGSRGFKTSPSVVPRQTKHELERKQKTGEGPALNTESFSRPSVKSIASLQHGSSDSFTRTILLGGSNTQHTNTMEDNHNHDSTTHEKGLLSNTPLTSDLLESRRSSRIYKVESRGGSRENGKRLNPPISALSRSIDNRGGLLESTRLLEARRKSSRSFLLEDIEESSRKVSRVGVVV